MKNTQIFTNLTIIALAISAWYSESLAQTYGGVTNNNYKSVEVNIREIGDGSQQQEQRQRATSDSSEVETNIVTEDADDNFWTKGNHRSLSLPPGSASIVCEDRIISFSHTGGLGFGVGAASINLSDNSGSLPQEF